MRTVQKIVADLQQIHAKINALALSTLDLISDARKIADDVDRLLNSQPDLASANNGKTHTSTTTPRHATAKRPPHT